MAISYRRELLDGEKLSQKHYREVVIAPNDYLVFPSCVWHRCLAPESNARVIVNTLVKL